MAKGVYTVSINSNKNSIEKNREVDNSKHIYTLTEAIEETKFGKCQVILTILTGLSLLGSAIENTNISYVLPYAKCDLELNLKEQGLLSGISYFGIVFSSHLWGFLADTWGRRKVLQVSAAGAFIFSFSSAFAANTIIMIFLRFCAGACVAGATSAGFSYISEFHTSSTAPRAAAFISIGLYCVWPLMSPLAMLVIPMDWKYSLQFVEFKPWRLFLMCTSLINLFNAIFASFIPESPKFLLSMNRKEEALEVLSRVYSINTGNSKHDYPVKHIENVTLGNSLSNTKGFGEILGLVVKQTTPIFKKPLLENTLKFGYIMFANWLMAHGSFMWFPDFLHHLQSHHGAPKILCEVVVEKITANSTTQICDINHKNIEPFQLLFVAGLFFMVASMVASYCVNKIPPKIFVCSWLFTSMVCGILLNFVDNFYLTVIFYVVFMCSAICSSIIMAVAVNLYPTNCRAMATSFIMLFGRLGSANGSSVIGLMLPHHCTMIFYVFGGVFISCALVFAMIKIKPQ